jgi:hypothetical protein
LTGAQRLPVPPTLAGDGGRGGRSLVHDADAYAVLATSLGLPAADLENELAQRAAFLTALADRGICAPPDVARAVAAYPNPPVTASEGARA